MSSFTWSSDDDTVEFIQKNTKKRSRELSSSDSDSDSDSYSGESDMRSLKDEAKGPDAVKKTTNKRQAKLPSKLQEYDVDLFGEQNELPSIPRNLMKSWFIIEWEGENTYDPVQGKNLSSLSGGEPEFKMEEMLMAVCSGRPYKGKIAAIGETKAEAEKRYLSARKPEKNKVTALKKPKKLPESRPEYHKKNVQKKTIKKLTQNQMKAKEKKIKKEVELEIMKQATENGAKQKPNYTSATKLQSSPKSHSEKTNMMFKAQIERNQQEIKLLKNSVSSLQDSLAKLMSPPICEAEVTPVGIKKTAMEPCLPDDKDLLKKIDESPSQVSGPGIKGIPQHLKSKASKLGSVKKAARCLTVGLFTAAERKSSTLTGGNGKDKLDENRVSLLHDFLRSIFQKSYDAFLINRIIGQVCIETRAGRHDVTDSIVQSFLCSK